MNWFIYLINLDENTQRLENSHKQLAKQGLKFKRIEAINGWKLGKDEVDLVYDTHLNAKKYKVPLVQAEIGCYLSHHHAWKTIADGEAHGGFIFEDDFLAAPILKSVLSMLAADKVDDWDMVKLFSFDQKPKVVAMRQLGEGINIVQPFSIPTCLIGYALTREGASKLVAKPLRIFRPVDEDQKFFWETGLRVSTILPSPIKVGDQIASTGTIGKSRRNAGRKKGWAVLTKLWRGIRYQLSYKCQLVYHRILKF